MDVTANIDGKMDNGEVEALIEQYKYGRYCEDQNLPMKGSQSFMLDYVRRYLSLDDSKYAVAFSSSGQILGLLLFKLSKWDNEHFGYNVIVIDSVIIRESDYDHKRNITNALLEQFHVWCQANRIRFVSVRVPSLDLPVVHSFESSGFRYIESWIYNTYDLNRIDEFGKTPYELRLAQPDDCRIMLDYSTGAFATHRFHADPHINYQKADSLYEKWILTAFGDPDQQILVLDVENRPTAFMLYSKKDLSRYFGLQFAIWKMALLDPTSRSRGVGTDFFIALLDYHRRDGLDFVDSSLSMRNLASLNLHSRLNFRVVSTLVTFHKWLK